MSLSKIVITGEVTRTPEKRFTDNNVAISAFSLNFGTVDEEKLVRVLSFGGLADRVAADVKKGQKVLVEGTLQTNSSKTESGDEKKFYEISAKTVEILGQSEDLGAKSYSEKEDEFSLADEIGDDLIGEDEIPF
ncbi:MAG: single-stranded DNA-binding protein [Candidatus Gastranaerophilales bacterium]|nr:single-stranded DNA-binding protein [Candidatus Gastranaerophilales bacterium]